MTKGGYEMRKTRKMLAILLAAVMAVGLLPTNFGGGTAFAAVAASGTPGSVSFSANAPSNDRDYTVKVQFYVDNAYQSEQTVRLHRDKWDNSTAVSFSASPNSGYTLDKVTNNWGTALASSITLYKNGGDNNTLKAYFKTSGSAGAARRRAGAEPPARARVPRASLIPTCRIRPTSRSTPGRVRWACSRRPTG